MNIGNMLLITHRKIIFLINKICNNLAYNIIILIKVEMNFISFINQMKVSNISIWSMFIIFKQLNVTIFRGPQGQINISKLILAIREYLNALFNCVFLPLDNLWRNLFNFNFLIFKIAICLLDRIMIIQSLNYLRHNVVVIFLHFDLSSCSFLAVSVLV